ncbi:hypothetical protein V497_03812, partial [Pseudogymnoascus sp. VKM F-4516 (FW-969)]
MLTTRRGRVPPPAAALGWAKQDRSSAQKQDWVRRWDCALEEPRTYRYLAHHPSSLSSTYCTSALLYNTSAYAMDPRSLLQLHPRDSHDRYYTTSFPPGAPPRSPRNPISPDSHTSDVPTAGRARTCTVGVGEPGPGPAVLAARPALRSKVLVWWVVVPEGRERGVR